MEGFWRSDSHMAVHKHNIRNGTAGKGYMVQGGINANSLDGIIGELERRPTAAATE
jgi:hypothetical protein